MIEQHYTDEALLSLLDARGSDTLLGDPHLAACATCADAMESYRDLAGLLCDKEVWDEEDEVFESAAEIFRVMSAPMRLKIISCLCNGEKNVTQLLVEIETTQPNMSQHLNTLYQAGVLGKRRDGVQIYYRIVNDRVVTLCRAVCTQIAIEADDQR